MKRSTLTLSILTALLVSACGGSSSNDDQTKDPTPPKVTPTNPSTPSTGRTPTTGNKDNAGTSGSSAGTSASSSSSSEPNIPISSGSAPSGGKPIVITSETKETPEEDKNDPPKDDGLKKIQEDLAAARESLAKSKRAKLDAELALDLQRTNKTTGKSTVSSAWEAQNALRKEFFGNDAGLDLNNYTDNSEEALRTIEVALEIKKEDLIRDGKYDGLQKKLARYKRAIDAYENEENKVSDLINEVYLAAKKEVEDQKKVDDLEAKILKARAEIPAEENLYKAAEQKADLQYELGKKAAELAKLTAEAEQNGNLNKGLQAEKKDLTKAKAKAGTNKALADEIEKEIQDIDEKITANEAKQKELDGQKATAEAAQNAAANNLATVETSLKDLKEVAKNRGVAGNSDFSQQNFLAVTEAKLEKDSNQAPKTWKLKFSDGSSFDVVVADTGQGSLSHKIQTGGTSNTVYGKFGKGGTKNDVLVAFQDSSDDKKSIYGYIGERFYSVGEVSDPDVVKGLTYANYEGKALLQAVKEKGGTGLVANVRGSLQQGKFTGVFKDFASYDRNPKTNSDVTTKAIENAALKEALKDDIQFHATVKENSNKFATEKANPGEASVYGYFYGDKAQEAGGLVELKNVFHGSFGGALK